MSTIYEITEKYIEFLDMAEDIGIEDNKIIDKMETIQDELENKFENYGKIIKELLGKSEIINKEADRLSKKSKVLENRAKMLKERLKYIMIYINKKKIKTNLFNFSIQKNLPSLKIINREIIPKEFYIEQELKLDKEKLKKELKQGKEIKGVELEQKESLRIRQ